MLRILVISFLTYFTLGTLILPLGDFRTLTDVPKMYAHCKATEDKDMTPWDFIKDHLVNWDGLIDKHDAGDQQKPHAPLPSSNIPQFLVCVLYTHESASIINVSIKTLSSIYIINKYTLYSVLDILRPPQHCI